MSRLQVGGLALVINSRHTKNIGSVVRLIENIGFHESPWGNGRLDYWKIKYEHHEDAWHCPSICLMPLGDDQTQAEFTKELDELVF